MTTVSPPDLETRIRDEIDLAVAPYVGKTSPVVMRQLRAAAERYFREHPDAVRILEVLGRNQQVRSGEVTKRQPGDDGEALAETPRKLRKV